MRLLLDTCCLIWLTQEPKRLSRSARAALDDESNSVVLSHASIWELYNKSTAGKLKLPRKPPVWVSEQIAVWGMEECPIDRASLDRMSSLPLHHRDPFDRMLAAQALVHRLIVVTPDEAFQPYGVSLLW